MPYIGQRPLKGDENNFKILDDISSYTLTFDGSDSSVVSAANDTITSLNHRFITGQRVTYNKGGGTVITGLSDGVYFIIKEDHNTIKLATSANNAISGTAVNITNVGSGSSHTLNVAFDGVNTKFKATHTNGVKAKITRSAQLVISINGVIQQPHDSTAPSTGFGFDLDGVIVLSQAPASTDIFWAHVLTNNNVTFDISDNDLDSFTGDGSTTVFNLSKTPPDNRNVLVTIDGVVQRPNDPDGTTRAYSVVENVLTFASAPASGTEIQVRHIGFAGSVTGGSVTNFYGRTGNAVLKSTDNIVVGDATVTGDLTVDGDFTTLNTTLREVELLRVDANSSAAAGIITQRGSGDILKLHDGAAELFTVADGGNVTIKNITGTPNFNIQGTNASNTAEANLNFLLRDGNSADLTIAKVAARNTGNGGYGALDFYTAFNNTNTRRMVIHQDGNVGINESENINGRLHIQHDALNENILYASRYNQQSIDKPVFAVTQAQIDGMTHSGLIIGNHNHDIHLGAVFGADAAVSPGIRKGIRIGTGYGQVGINTSVHAEAYTGLSVRNHTTPDNDTIIDIVADDDKTSRLYFSENSNRGKGSIRYSYTSDANFMSFYTNGTAASNERVRIDNNGRVGLGITNPGDYFSSYNRVVMGRPNDSGSMTIVSAPTFGGYISFADGTSGNQAYRGLIMYAHGGDYMTFNTDSTEKLRITSGGFVGIGVTNPEDYSSGGKNLVVGSSGQEGITIRSSSPNTGNLLFNDGLNLIAGISFKHDSTASNRYFAFNINNGSSYVEQLRIQDGKLIFNNDQDSYIQGSGDRFTFTTGGSEVFRIMYNRIGLNGVHPPNSHANVTSSIHLANQNTILSRTGDQYFALFQNLKYTAQDTVRYLVNGYASAYAQNAGSHRFYTVGNGTGNTNATVTERFRITNDGEILLPAAGANRISMRHYGGGTAVIKNPTAARLAFGTNNQDFEFVINNGGDVGIGSATPIERLVVQGDAFSNLTYDQDGGGFTSTSGGALVLTGYYDYSGAKLGLMVDNAGQGRIMTKTNQSLLIGTNDLKVITINGSGQTGINTTPQGQLFSIRGATDIMHYPNSSIGNNRIQIGFNGPEGYIKAKNTTGSPAANIALYTTNASGTTSKVLHCSYMGDIYAGNETGYAFFDNSTLRPRYQFRQGTGTNRGFAIIETRGDANGQDVFIAKSREGNGTGLINAGDNLGKINFAGADGTNMVNGAQIFAYTQSTATVAADRMPTNLSFRTHDDNTAGLKERIRIHHDGRVSMSKNGWAGSDATFGLTVHTGSTSETGPVGDGIMIVSQQNNGNQNSSTGKLMFCGHAQTNGPFMYGDNTNAWGKKDLVFHTTSTANSYSTQLEETARFNYQGRFGVNTGTSVNARMHLYDTGTANSNGFRFETGTSGVTAKFVIKTTDNGDESKYLRLNGHWTEVGVHNNEGFRIRNSGNSIAMYVNSGGSYRFYGSNLSDRNLKEDIETISTPTIDLIKQVSPKLFKWKNDPNKTQHGGFIAQEMQPLFPKLINGTDYDESRTDYGAPGEDQEPGNPTGLAFDYDGYTAYLTKAMQELITEVETLKAKVAALEGQ